MQGKTARQGRPPRGSRLRWVYFIQGQTTGLIKIGVADSVEARLSMLQPASPDLLTVIGTVRCNRYGALERELHVMFAAHRRHGEWFSPHPEILSYIASPTATAPVPIPARKSLPPRAFSEDEADEIWRRLRSGERPGDIAKDYGVGPKRISTIQAQKMGWVNHPAR
jgi:hypothetical protein